MVAVVERGGFLWFCNFFVGFVAFVFFFVSRKPAPWWSIAGSLMVVPGVFDDFVAYGQGRWLYGEVFVFLNRFGLLSFCLRAFLFWFHSTSLFGCLHL